MPAQTSTPPPSLFQQQQAAAKPAAVAVDPFAALNSPVRQATPQQNQPSTTKSMFDFAQPAQSVPSASHDDDEWNFSSATLPESDAITITNTSVKIDLKASRASQTDPVINLDVSFSNNVTQPITELTFQVAVTKVCDLDDYARRG